MPSMQQWQHTHTHTHNRLTALFPGLPRWAGTRKVKPIWIFLDQETVSGSGISWAMYKSAPRTTQITTPAPHHSIFYRQDGLPAAQPTASKHWRQHINKISNLTFPVPRTELLAGIDFLTSTCRPTTPVKDKKLRYRWGTARCTVSVEMLSTATQQCRNYLYDKLWKKIKVMKSEGYGGAMCNKHLHSTMTRFESLQLSYRCHKQTGHGRVVDITNIPTTCCGKIFKVQNVEIAHVTLTIPT